MKYMGSKNRIAKHILPIILRYRKEGQLYWEPFVGGLNMIDKVDGRRLGTDSNKYLISFIKKMQTDWELPAGIDKEFYDKVKSNIDNTDPAVVGLVGFCFTYSAKWFGGFIGSPVDKVCVGRDRIGESYRAAEKVRHQAAGVTISCKDYSTFDPQEKCIIYCDPPYAGTTKYKDDFDHDSFFEWAREMSTKGHQVFISEYNAPDDFVCVWEKEIAVNVAKNSNGKKGTEKLFIHNSQVKEL